MPRKLVYSPSLYNTISSASSGVMWGGGWYIVNGRARLSTSCDCSITWSSPAFDFVAAERVLGAFFVPRLFPSCFVILLVFPIKRRQHRLGEVVDNRRKSVDTTSLNIRWPRAPDVLYIEFGYLLIAKNNHFYRVLQTCLTRCIGFRNAKLAGNEGKKRRQNGAL